MIKGDHYLLGRMTSHLQKLLGVCTKCLSEHRNLISTRSGLASLPAADCLLGIAEQLREFALRCDAHRYSETPNLIATGFVRDIH